MSQRLRIGLVLPNIPGYSETFILSKIQGLINTGNSVAKRFKLDTRIMWTDNFGNEKEMELSTVQLIMNKAF